MNWQEVVETLIDVVNAALEVGDWAAVVCFTDDLYMAALHVDEMELAELVQDLHWIANDALVYPLEVEKVVSA